MNTTPDPALYRPGGGIVLRNPRGDIFAGARKDFATRPWQMPQGGIDPGEEPLDAAFRELEEEIGTRQARLTVEMPGWLFYDLPEAYARKAWGGRFHGQRQKWFLMDFLGEDSDIDIATAHPEFSEWRWTRPVDLMAEIVSFKRGLYRDVLRAFDLID